MSRRQHGCPAKPEKGHLMPDRLDKFVHDKNLKNFAAQMASETDPIRLAQLLVVLKEEQARVAGGAPKLPKPD